MKKKSTHGTSLSDVAKHAGVSLATVSRVLSNSSYPVNASTKRKVYEAAKELQYYPGRHSSAYKSQNTAPIIGVIVPTLHNPFFSEVILGIESSASSKGCQIMVFSSHRSVEEERSNINSLLQRHVSALIIISIDSSGETLENFILCGGRVAILESDFRLNNSIITHTDHAGAGRLAAEHLISCGHQKIAFFTSPLTKTYRRAILVGIREAMKEAHLPFSEANIFVANNEKESDTGHYEFDMGRHLTQAFLPHCRDFTAIIAINDLTALGIIQALTQNNISVPDDISVISFDNIPYSGMINPPLTTVDLPSVSLGRSACDMLINTLNGTDESLSGIVFEYSGKLVERNSVRRITSSSREFIHS